MTNSDVTPKPKISIIDPIDLNITFLLQQISKDLQLNFKIDRAQKSCHTPRRNDDVAAALQYLQSWYNWATQVGNYFTGRLFPVQVNHGLDLSIINGKEMFVPVVPLFEENRALALEQSSAVPPSPLFTVGENIPSETPGDKESLPFTFRVGDINLFLAEQTRSFDAKFAKLAKTFPKDEKLITVAEAKLLSILLHSKTICENFSNGVNYIEYLLRTQLISAIGKIVTPVDFANYMTYHNRKIFKPDYEPQKFCYAVRRPDHYPEGIVSLDCKLNDGSISEPISTMVNHQKFTKHPMRFTLSAAATVSFFGDRYVHAWMGHQFSGDAGGSFSLSARARQFSSFILLVGNIISADLFDPQFGIIVQNKDDLLIPLLFEQIPTPKAFRDAIESLSPEQQDFAKAFRSMQLESTMFGVCIIQIKPQLEKLLNIPDDSLTKEIQLTQDLLRLFIDYQIPSDLISFDEDDHPNASTPQKIEIVKQHVATMFQMIEKSKQRELDEAKLKTKYEVPLIEEREMTLKSVDYSSMKKERKVKKSVKRKCKKKSVATSSSVLKSVKPKPGAGASQPVEVAKSVEAPKPADPEKQSSNEFEPVSDVEVDGLDVTKIPAMLDAKFEIYDEDCALHSTIIKAGTTWEKKYLESLLAKPTARTLNPDDLKSEKNKAFDLLDALTRSGGLAVDGASFHVVLASTHCFDETLMDTIIKDNINPIEKIERSSLIVASTIQQVPPADLLVAEHLDRIKELSPALFAD
eukprot:CAMPEP_0117035768 /NCGR_PEP_ID=MMETSP0472-20121206/25381_1 /TAXON_ID=693140 ORGANISM="Tiarina fusus, Strain LIS" /NCGR_SAMPLE_ID=MMETSP0472 /ASSEMBLY_ACC=CAM_ASM_000603 /LENGTH=748 /DNA_ID=CAMNT_0004745333 /DNA_START=1359 /DNA_END=3605 /DNA_ORIENTATION=+